jgi:hypothetical protein
MRLVGIEYAGLPGFPKRYFFPTADPAIWTGPNDSGKTTALSAVFLALNGFTEAMPDGSMVCAHFELNDAAWMVRREMVSGKQGLVAGGVTGVRAAQAEIKRVLGTAGAFSARDYMDLSADKRQRALEPMLRLDVTAAAVRERLAAAGIDVAWNESQVDREGWSEDGQKYLAELIDGMRLAYTACNNRLKDLRGADRLDSNQTPTTPGTVAMWRKRLAKIDAEIHELTRQAGEAVGAEVARKELESALEAIEKRAASTALLAAKNAKATAEDGLRECEAALERRGHVLDQCASVHKLRQEEWRAARNALDRWSKANEIVVALSQLEVLWEAVGEVARASDGMVEALEAGGMIKLPEALGKLESIYYALDAIRQNGDPDEAAGHRALVDAAHRASERAGSERIQAGEAHTRAKNALERAKQELSHRRQAVESAQQTATADSERREELLNRLGELPTMPEATAEALKGLRSKRVDVQASHDQANDAAAKWAADEERRLARTSATVARDKLRESGKKAKVLEAELLQESLTPVLGIAERICMDVLGKRLRVTFNKGALVSLETENGGHRWMLSAASQSERVVAMMALQVALQNQLDGWRHVVVDDLEALEQERRTRFTAAMAQLHSEGVIDNFLGASVADGWEAPESLMDYDPRVIP